jgi:hypothetical protein
MHRVTAAFGLTAFLVAGGQAKAETILLTCQYDYHETDGSRGVSTDDPFSLDISEKRVIEIGETNLHISADQPFNFIDISPRLITYGIHGHISDTGTIVLDTLVNINRGTGVITWQHGQNRMTGSCQKENPTR